MGLAMRNVGSPNDRGAVLLNDCNLSNTTMETFVQATSCVACHAFAAPLGDRGANSAQHFPTDQIFTFVLRAAQAPPAPPILPGFCGMMGASLGAQRLNVLIASTSPYRVQDFACASAIGGTFK